MSSSWIRETDDYEIETELYSGPLDLLLDLIQKSELDISKIALAQVTDQFLIYVRQNEHADPDYISEFMVIASKLVQIKSEAMLPRAPLREPDEEDLGEALARQLRIYREIKKHHCLAQFTSRPKPALSPARAKIVSCKRPVGPQRD